MKFICLLLSILTTSVFADFPSFKEFKVEVYEGDYSAIQLNKETRLYKTKFRALQNENINYAGHYVIDFIGCGGGCVLGLAYNVKTGKTLFLPFGALSSCYENGVYTDQDYVFEIDSKLIISTGLHDGDEHCSVKYFIESDGEFKLLLKTYL